jgi:isoleucyl-tRNA synthetase
MFDAVDPKQSFPKLEQGILSYWKEEHVFQRSAQSRSSGEIFSFYDGPPFATGLPHYGHLLAGTIKDVIPRYQTMKGKYVERRFGWDCHGLPIENLIEKEHDIKTKREIEEMGTAAFNELCKSSVQRYVKEWRATVERTGRWVDMDWDYRTMDPEYMESIWWVLSVLWGKKLMYAGYKPMHVCPRCVTPLSNFEVNQGYKDVTDLSATVRFKLRGEKETYVLAWTTTPWTLPGNLFLAIGGGDVKYVFVKHEGARYVVAEALVEKVFKDKEHEVAGHATHEWLLGKTYEPLFPYFYEEYKDRAFRIVDGREFVTVEDGTGIVHIAPGFGEDDFQIGKREKTPMLQHVTMEGTFIAAVKDFAGQHVKPIDDPAKTDRKVAEWLEKHGKLFKKESYKHSYPHCWRCDSPLLNYATSSWFVSVEKIKEAMLTANKQTEWVPSHLRDGRFGKWLEGARDWAISRNRYWGTPLPIWRCEETGDIEVVGSRDELMRRNLLRFSKISVLRHGESEHNLIPIYEAKAPGHSLTARGKKQAEGAAAWLKTQNVNVIYSSPLVRCLETANAIAKATDATVIVDERLREVAFGEYEGKTIDSSDLALVKAKRAHKLQAGSPESVHRFAGMETWGEAQARLNDFMQEVLPKHRSDHLVIVTHGDLMNNAKQFFTGEDPVKISHQPYPEYATPVSYFWDHERSQPLDLHKHIVDDIMWWGSASSAGSLTLTRHGETEWNAEGKIQGGEKNIALNEKGKAQALETAQRLKKQTFDVIVSSDLERAMQTAEIIGKELGLKISEKSHLFRERDFGTWNGKTREELKAHPHKIPGDNISFHHETPMGGEPFSTYLKRVKEGYLHLLKTYPGKRVLLVTHSGVLRAMKTMHQKLSYEEGCALKIPNLDTYEMPLGGLMKRIPEVLDCWFESGSMPYAQSHFPFEYRVMRRIEGDEVKIHSTKAGAEPPGFPADFIAEGIDQTRGWFYTLTVLAAGIYGKPAFRHCVVNGTVLAEDGRKMSKRLKNYPDPNEVIERYGADALRFTLMKSPAVRAEDLRFSEKSVEETLRSTLLPLWNCFAFFVTYANAAGFEGIAARRHSSHPLDQYIRAEVQDLVNRMSKQLDAYDLSATCKELEETIDALTNWYIRLSRRRFAGKGAIDAADAAEEVSDDARHEALMTLHETLVTVSQLLAPFCPFLADAIYLNLVPEAHGSVHLTDWPEPRQLSQDEVLLLSRNRLLRRVVSLGLKVRSEKKIKTRQPLSQATVAIPPHLLEGAELSEEDLQLLRQELNVKQVSISKDPGSLGTVIVQVNARKVGPRLGGRVQEVIAAGKHGEFTIQGDGSILILDERLSADEASVSYQGKEGQDIAAEGGIVVSIDTRVGDELKAEGQARDLIRAVQKLRKEAGFAMTDRVNIAIEGADTLLKSFRELIEQETNTVIGTAKGEAVQVDLDEMSVSITLEKAS